MMENCNAGALQAETANVQNSEAQEILLRGKLLDYGSSSLILGSLVNTEIMDSAANSAEAVIQYEQGDFKLSSASEKFMSMFDLQYPFVQAPIGSMATPNLVAAVCNASCLGGLPLSWLSPANAKESIAAVKAGSNGVFFANFELNFEPLALQTALEAGEHVHATMPLKKALKSVLAVAGDIPVIASGGIETGDAIHGLLHAGAGGVVMGTRFAATKEGGTDDAHLGVSEIHDVPSVQEMIDKVWHELEWREFEHA